MNLILINVNEEVKRYMCFCCRPLGLFVTSALTQNLSVVFMLSVDCGKCAILMLLMPLALFLIFHLELHRNKWGQNVQPSFNEKTVSSAEAHMKL